MSKFSRSHYNTLEVSLAWTLRELREQPDVHMRLDAQITFWRVVEGLIRILERDNSKFDAHHFTEEIMRYAGLEVVTDDRDWFLKKMRKEP